MCWSIQMWRFLSLHIFSLALWCIFDMTMWFVHVFNNHNSLLFKVPLSWSILFHRNRIRLDIYSLEFPPTLSTTLHMCINIQIACNSYLLIHFLRIVQHCGKKWSLSHSVSFPFCNPGEILLNICALFIIIFHLLCMGGLMICLHLIMVLLVHQIVTCSGNLIKKSISSRFLNESKISPK